MKNKAALIVLAASVAFFGPRVIERVRQSPTHDSSYAPQDIDYLGQRDDRGLESDLQARESTSARTRQEVRGRVCDGGGTGLGGAKVYLSTANSWSESESSLIAAGKLVISDSEGRFSLPFDGESHLLASLSGFETACVETANLSSNKGDAAITLGAGVSINGRVTDSSGIPLAGVLVTVRSRSIDEAAFAGLPSRFSVDRASARTDERGLFEVRGLKRGGAYVVRALKDGFVPVPPYLASPSRLYGRDHAVLAPASVELQLGVLWCRLVCLRHERHNHTKTGAPFLTKQYVEFSEGSRLFWVGPDNDSPWFSTRVRNALRSAAGLRDGTVRLVCAVSDGTNRPHVRLRWAKLGEYDVTGGASFALCRIDEPMWRSEHTVDLEPTRPVGSVRIKRVDGAWPCDLPVSLDRIDGEARIQRWLFTGRRTEDGHELIIPPLPVGEYRVFVVGCSAQPRVTLRDGSMQVVRIPWSDPRVITTVRSRYASGLRATRLGLTIVSSTGTVVFKRDWPMAFANGEEHVPPSVFANGPVEVLIERPGFPLGRVRVDTVPNELVVSFPARERGRD